MNTETVGTGLNLISFGEAVAAMKEGKRVCRNGWNGKGLFVFKQVPSIVPISVVPKMSSLPYNVKEEFSRRYREEEESPEHIEYHNQYCMVYPDNTIYGWIASPSDISEDDWVVLD